MYRFTYESADFGTERRLKVYDSSGVLVESVDPFPRGIPVDALTRAKKLKTLALQIARKHKGGK